MSDPLVTPWTSGGDPHEVSTAKLPGESDDDHRARHTEAVEFLQRIYPPDPE